MLIADDRAVICLSLGGFLLLFGTTSYLIRGKFFLSTAVVALIFGGSRRAYIPDTVRYRTGAERT